MRSWLARAVGAPGSATFRRFHRVVADATARQAWADSLDPEALLLAARGAITAPRRDPGVEPTADLLAILRTAAQRALGQEPFDEQLLACCALLAGHAVEMDTGEG